MTQFLVSFQVLSFCDSDVIWYQNAEDEHISLARVPIPEAQPLGPDSLGSCTEANAVDLGAQQVPNTVAANACLKVTQYPGQWMNFVVLQAQQNGSTLIPCAAVRTTAHDSFCGSRDPKG